MTTAHRPTFKPAIGGSEQGGNKMLVHSRSYHSKDLPAYLTLKLRKTGQGTQEELALKDLKQDLLQREYEGKKKKELKALGVSETSLAIKGDTKIEENEEKVVKKIKPLIPNFQDQDDKELMKSSDDEIPKEKVKQESDLDKDYDDEEDDEEDDDELLMREFEKIKQERQLEEKKKILEKQRYLDENREEEIIKGNPLLVNEDYSLKKKWYEDTIFRNQSRLEVKERQRFVNDAVRSDFHRKFLNKYIMM